MTELTLPLPPSVNRLWRGNRNGRRWCDPAAVGFKQTAALTLLSMRVRPIVGPVELDVVFVVNPRKPLDADNGLKVLLDALQGVAFENDSQVRKLGVELVDDDGKGPRTLLRFGPKEDDGPRAEFEALLRRA